MPAKPTKAQLDRAAKVVAFEHRDPLTDVRHCRWCLMRTPDAHQDGGEYFCPQCLRWQHDKAFPQGVPGASQEVVQCVACGTEQGFAVGDEAPHSCPACGGRALSALGVPHGS